MTPRERVLEVLKMPWRPDPDPYAPSGREFLLHEELESRLEQAITAAVEERDKDWSHALEQALVGERERRGGNLGMEGHNAITRILIRTRAERDEEWSHALKQAVESQFPGWNDPHERPASPDVDYAGAWLKRLIEHERERWAKVADEEATAPVPVETYYLEGYRGAMRHMAHLLRARSEGEKR